MLLWRILAILSCVDADGFMKNRGDSQYPICKLFGTIIYISLVLVLCIEVVIGNLIVISNCDLHLASNRYLNLSKYSSVIIWIFHCHLNSCTIQFHSYLIAIWYVFQIYIEYEHTLAGDYL